MPHGASGGEGSGVGGDALLAARNDVLSAPRMLSQVRKVPLAHRYLRMSLSCQGELLVSSVLSVALFLPLLVAAVVGALALFTFRTARRIEAALPPPVGRGLLAV